ncbi:MAG: hypothetical protein QOH21_3429, partial [Acidobacteriota bacterium]|nr:hypothetical protein [Acidobacteriota bacterium]
ALKRWIDQPRACAAIRGQERTLYDSFLLSLPAALACWLENGVGG